VSLPLGRRCAGPLLLPATSSGALPLRCPLLGGRGRAPEVFLRLMGISWASSQAPKRHLGHLWRYRAQRLLRPPAPSPGAESCAESGDTQPRSSASSINLFPMRAPQEAESQGPAAEGFAAVQKSAVAESAVAKQAWEQGAAEQEQEEEQEEEQGQGQEQQQAGVSEGVRKRRGRRSRGRSRRRRRKGRRKGGGGGEESEEGVEEIVMESPPRLPLRRGLFTDPVCPPPSCTPSCSTPSCKTQAGTPRAFSCDSSRFGPVPS